MVQSAKQIVNKGICALYVRVIFVYLRANLKKVSKPAHIIPAEKDQRSIIEQTYPITTVGAAIYNANGEILFVRSHKWSNKWSVPGGKIDLGESAEEALIREIREETSLRIVDIEFLTTIDSVFEKEFYKRVHMILLNYKCKTNATTVVLNEEAQGFCWAKPASAITMDLNRPTKVLVDFLLKNV